MFERKRYVLFIALAVFCGSLSAVNLKGNAQTSSAKAQSYQLINGNWFDGQGFRRQTFYSVNGVLQSKKPPKVDEVIDLKNGYVVPPFADAHCHHFRSLRNVEQQVGMYLKDGIFYAKVQADARSESLQIIDKVNHPKSVDVSYSHGALTASYGHGIQIYEGLAVYNRTFGFNAEEIQKLRESRLRDNDAYYIIDTAADLEQKWPRILEGKPDFIKIYLVTSEEFEERTKRTATIGDRGVNPLLVPMIVKKAHSAGLRVSAHVDTITDYRIALRAGVDEMAHLPGYYIGLEDNLQKYELTEEVVRESARRRVWVDIAPVAIEIYNPQDPKLKAQVKERIDRVKVHNLKLLKRFKTKIAFGSDWFGRTPVNDVLYIQRLGVFSNLELLKIWCEDTPVSIFPNRKIGLLKAGYEASFLVLDGNPLEDFEQIKKINLRFKQGHLLDAPK
jgi:imidazolonepropionase-like amidohydrolase